MVAEVGEHLGADVEGERLVTHRFACLDPAYRGWHWAVTVTRLSRSRTVTVCDSVLLPGDDALLAKEWVPWSKRLEPGDLGVGDLLPTEADDDRLEPGYALDARAEDAPTGRGLGARPGPRPGAVPAGPRRRGRPLVLRRAAAPPRRSPRRHRRPARPAAS